MVIRCSSVSTLTRIDWLAILSASWTSASAAAALRAGFALASLTAPAPERRPARRGSRHGGGAAASVSVSRKARSRSSSETSPGRSGRSSTWSTSVPLAISGVAISGVIAGATGGAATTGAACSGSACALPSAIACSFSIRSSSVPSGSVSVASSPARISLMRSMLDRISVTASALTGMPSRNLPISVSPACASASSRGRPRKPQVPLIVCTRRKMLSRIFASFGSCSNRTS